MSKKFVSDTLIHQGELSEPSYRVEWPSLAPKKYASTFLEHLKEAEDKVLKKAREKALFIEKEAYEKGFAQGEKDGLELGRKRIDTLVRQITNLLEDLQNQREVLYQSCEREMLQLVLSISKKVLRHELRLNDEVVLSTLKEASKYVMDQQKIVLRLNPADVQLLESRFEQCPPIGKGARAVTMIRDTSLTRGGCVIETSFGDIDGTIETQMDQIVSLLWDRFEQSAQALREET